MPNFVEGLEGAVKRLRDTEEANIHLLKSLHDEIQDRNEKTESVKITVEKSSPSSLTLKVGDLPSTTIYMDLDGQKFLVNRGSIHHPDLDFLEMKKVLQKILAEDMFRIEKKLAVFG